MREEFQYPDASGRVMQFSSGSELRDHIEGRTEALYSFTQSLGEASDLQQVLDAITRHFLETFRQPIVVLLPDDGRLSVQFHSAGLAFDDLENAAAAWVFENAGEAGCGTKTFPESRVRYWPLKTWQGVVGVLGIQLSSMLDPLPLDFEHFARAFLNQAALAITRADLDKKAQRAEILQEADKLQKALLNSISHNLRSPIASIVGALASVLEDGSLLDANTQRHLLETAQEEAIKLNRLVQNLLDMSRLEGGVIHVKREPCDVRDVVGASLEQLGEPARKRPISVMIQPDLPLVPMDQVLVVQVIANLLDNAFKYSPVDAVIKVDACMDNGQLLIQVEDGGDGIPEQDLERVFEKFFRGTLPGMPRGAGLGLPICKGFVEAHDGRIWAKRREDGGTAVAFLLPTGAKR